MPEKDDVSGREERWAHFRFSVIGPLLAAPPERGDLKQELEILAGKKWRHPVTGQSVQFSLSTIERWYYLALGEPKDPVGVLGRKIRQDCGTHPSLNMELRGVLLEQYRKHPSWSYQLHADNLAVVAEQNPNLGLMPSYPSLRRFMKAHGLLKRRRQGRGNTPGAQAAEKRFEAFEIRSYESQYANALWHLDFHHGSLKVLLPEGQWAGVHLLGVLDDHSRLCAHAQWYLSETAENLVHGLCQAFEKRGLPRALMSDNGSAMTAAETVQGLERLGIIHEKTLPYSAYHYVALRDMWRRIAGLPP